MEQKVLTQRQAATAQLARSLARMDIQSSAGGAPGR